MARSDRLLQTPLFQRSCWRLPHGDQLRIFYKRAQALGKLYDFAPDDILFTTSKYWELHSDPILTIDSATAVLLTIHYNLCCGTLAQFITERPDIATIVKQLLAYDVSGQFCLTELGHGLDAINIETTATLQEDGGFVLNTPHPKAAKFMPPTSPSGIPCVAVVFARLMVHGEDHGIRPFVVPLHDGYNMHAGIISRLLSPRGGTGYIGHCLTYFHHVHLPYSALLGSLDRPTNLRNAFFSSISRVIVGSLSMAYSGIPALKAGVTIAALYSKRRVVIDSFTRMPRSIITFPTQHIPIFTALAQILVLQSFLKTATAIFTSEESDSGLRHCIAAIAKAVVLPQAQSSLLSLSERCGAQGLFEINQMTSFHAGIRGAATAEGDILVVSIRFAAEIMLGRIDLPPANDTESVLARHEAHMLQELREILWSMSHHRSAEFESKVLPRCQPLLRAIGDRIAYDSAHRDQVPQDIINLYVANCFKDDSSWYAEHGGVPSRQQRELECEAISRLYPRLEEFLGMVDLEKYCMAPIISDEKWDRYVQGLEIFGSDIYTIAGLETEEIRARL